MSCLSGSVVREGDFLATVELVSGVSAVVEHSMGADITLYPMNGSAAALSPVNDAVIDISGGSSPEIDLTKIGDAEAGGIAGCHSSLHGRILWRFGMRNHLDSNL